MRERHTTQLEFRKLSKDYLWQIYTEDKTINVDADIHLKDAPTKIKVISNIVENVSGLFASLVKSKLQGINYKIINDIKELYDDIGDKMFILTNQNKSNTQLVKLNKQFSNLYQTIMSTLDNFTPPTSGGSMGFKPISKIIHNNTFFYTPTHIIKTDKLHLL